MNEIGRVSSPSIPSPNESSTLPTSPSTTSAAESFRARHFAQRRLLSWWFPRIDDDETKSWRIWASRRSRALMIQILTIGIILVTNLSVTLFAVSKYGSQDGVGLIYEGDCNTVKKLSLWIHLLINLLGTGMLSASNYCMQLQAAPTRANVDKAHAKGTWLDIGVPSLRNIRHLGRKRILTWLFLALSSVPIHLLYNSAVFQSLSSNDYAVAVVKDSFLTGSPFNLTTAANNGADDPGWDYSHVNPDYVNYLTTFSDIQREASTYKEMNISSCFDLYDDYWKPQGNVIILVKNETVQSPSADSLLMYVYVVPRWDDWGKNLWALSNGTGKFVAQSSPSQPAVTNWYLGPPRYEVSRCLVQDPTQINLSCRFQYSPHILVTICLMNFVKAALMLWAWVARRRDAKATEPVESQTLYTLGDAIASFMRVPDRTTTDMCLATKEDFSRKRPRVCFGKMPPKPTDAPREFRNEPKMWMQAASTTRWIILIATGLFVILIGGILLIAAFKSLHHRQIPTRISDLVKLGFGALTPYTYLVTSLPRSDPNGLISNVLVANLPQLVLSIVYVMYNAMMSTMLVQREFSLLYKTVKRKPLRVSEPIGIQRSSYFISLPLRYGVPLYITSGVMHFLLSQSLFLARITALYTDGTVDRYATFSTCAYSPIAMITAMAVGAGLLAAVGLLGLRKYDGTMRMVATNSRAISAACHVLEEDRENGYLMPVQWGVVKRSGGVGKCAFTTAPDVEIRMPKEGLKYR